MVREAVIVGVEEGLTRVIACLQVVLLFTNIRQLMTLLTHLQHQISKNEVTILMLSRCMKEQIVAVSKTVEELGKFRHQEKDDIKQINVRLMAPRIVRYMIQDSLCAWQSGLLTQSSQHKRNPHR